MFFAAIQYATSLRFVLLGLFETLVDGLVKGRPFPHRLKVISACFSNTLIGLKVIYIQTIPI